MVHGHAVCALIEAASLSQSVISDTRVDLPSSRVNTGIFTTGEQGPPIQSVITGADKRPSTRAVIKIRYDTVR